jgi:catechol 2,3-dioxygenase-like lactoylglutathione lyase family enzyme
VAARLRQAVLVARDLDAVAGSLRRELGLGAPFDADPYVSAFGLENRVFALGDQFLEVVSPVADGTTAGRRLERRGGDGGYMLLFQVDDLEAARERADAAGVRVVWSLELPEIAGLHLHPADLGGTIVSLDRPEPPESWHWAGPDWTGKAGAGAPGRLAGLTVAVPDPAATAALWAAVIGAHPVSGVTFVEGDRGLTEIALDLPEAVRHGRESVEIGGVRFRLAA